MEKRLNIKYDEIYKLKITKILRSGLIVKQMNGKEGFIHISEISDGYIENINKTFSISMYVYGKLISSEEERYNFSLKEGHTIGKDIQKRYHVYETNGGYMPIFYHMKAFLDNK